MAMSLNYFVCFSECLVYNKMHNNGICSMDISLSVYGEAGLPKPILLRVPRRPEVVLCPTLFFLKIKWDYILCITCLLIFPIVFIHVKYQ